MFETAPALGPAEVRELHQVLSLMISDYQKAVNCCMYPNIVFLQFWTKASETSIQFERLILEHWKLPALLHETVLITQTIQRASAQSCFGMHFYCWLLHLEVVVSK